MAINKVWVEEDCTSCGICESICPEVFEVVDIAVATLGIDYAPFDSAIRDAADSCPAEVIKFTEE